MEGGKLRNTSILERVERCHEDDPDVSSRCRTGNDGSFMVLGLCGRSANWDWNRYSDRWAGVRPIPLLSSLRVLSALSLLLSSVSRLCCPGSGLRRAAAIDGVRAAGSYRATSLPGSPSRTGSTSTNLCDTISAIGAANVPATATATWFAIRAAVRRSKFVVLPTDVHSPSFGSARRTGLAAPAAARPGFEC